MRKRCPICGTYLDPNEWCDCQQEHHEDEAPKKPKPPEDREHDWQDEYVQHRWREWYEN